MKPIPPGKIPTNTGGGLVGFGHPVGATGVKQILEVYRQMKGPSPPVLGSWGNTMRGAGRNKERSEKDAVRLPKILVLTYGAARRARCALPCPPCA